MVTNPTPFQPSTQLLRSHTPISGDLSSNATARSTTSSGSTHKSSHSRIVPSTVISSPSGSAKGGMRGLQDGALHSDGRAFLTLVVVKQLVQFTGGRPCRFAACRHGLIVKCIDGMVDAPVVLLEISLRIPLPERAWCQLIPALACPRPLSRPRTRK